MARHKKCLQKMQLDPWRQVKKKTYDRCTYDAISGGKYCKAHARIGLLDDIEALERVIKIQSVIYKDEFAHTKNEDRHIFHQKCIGSMKITTNGKKAELAALEAETKGGTILNKAQSGR